MNLTKLMKGTALSALAAAMAITALPAPAEAQSRERGERGENLRLLQEVGTPKEFLLLVAAESEREEGAG